MAIHDVGAGGLSNAFPELVNDAGRGATFELKRVHLEESGMSPAEIWSNESQERYVLAVMPQDLERFKALAERERCPFAVASHRCSPQNLVWKFYPSENPRLSATALFKIVFENIFISSCLNSIRL